MQHDVIVEIYTPGVGASRETVKVNAVGGDDAAEQGAIEAAHLATGRVWRIISVSPSTPEPEAPVAPLKARKQRAAPVATVEGDDFPDDPAV